MLLECVFTAPLVSTLTFGSSFWNVYPFVKLTGRYQTSP